MNSSDKILRVFFSISIGVLGSVTWEEHTCQLIAEQSILLFLQVPEDQIWPNGEHATYVLCFLSGYWNWS